MILYDDKTANTLHVGNQLLINSINSDEDITFKASFIVSGSLRCKGTIIALFNLIVYGDVEAEGIDVKGRFICMGSCSVNGAIIVQNDIWCEDIKANSVSCHDKIIAQSIDACTVIADGNIIVGKTLAIEEKAQTSQKVICGETAYGAGGLVAESILTAEPLDLDDGEEAIMAPHQYSPEAITSSDTGFEKYSVKYALNNDYPGYISKLSETLDEYFKNQSAHYLFVMNTIKKAYPGAIPELRDASLLIGMLEISHSKYFDGWNIVAEWTDSILCHFKTLANAKRMVIDAPKPVESISTGDIIVHKSYGKGVVLSDIKNSSKKGETSHTIVVDFDTNGEKKFMLPQALHFFSVLDNAAKESIQCSIHSYSEWLSSLQLIDRYKDTLGKDLYEAIFELLLAKIGLKPKFVEDRFKEKGWD